MDANHQKILDNLEEKEPRSRLAPYRDLILELRRRNRTYREILQILVDRCKIQVSISTLHEFLHAQRRIGTKLKKPQAAEKNKSDPKANQPRRRIELENPTMNNAQQKIAALKQRPMPISRKDLFSYDPSEPLNLQPMRKKIPTKE